MNVERSLFWTAGRLGLTLAVELVTLAIIGRLLTPADFGIYAAAFAIFQFCRFLGQFGLHSVVLRASSLTLALRQEVIAIIITAGGIVVTVVLLSILFFRSWFPDPSSVLLLIAMLPLIPVASFGMVAQAVLQRRLAFREIFFASVISALLFSVVAVSMALAGMDAESLVAGLAVSTTAHAVITNAMTGWMFAVRPSLTGFGDSVRFATKIFIATALAQTGQAASPLILGRLLGVDALGLFFRAGDIVQQGERIIQDAIIPALMPYMFIAENEGRDLKPMFLEALAHLTLVSWCLFALLVAVPDLLIRVMLGEQWNAVPQILLVLSFELIPFPALLAAQSLLLATQRENLFVVLAALHLPMLLISIAVGASSGSLLTTAACLVSAKSLNMGLMFSLASRDIGVTVGAIGRSILPSAIVAICVFGTASSVANLGSVASLSSALFWLVIAVASAGLVGFAAVLLTHHALGARARKLLIGALVTS